MKSYIALYVYLYIIYTEFSSIFSQLTNGNPQVVIIAVHAKNRTTNDITLIKNT